MGGGGGGGIAPILQPIATPIDIVSGKRQLKDGDPFLQDAANSNPITANLAHDMTTPPSMSTPGTPPPPPTPDLPAVGDASDKVRKAGANGKASTMLTGGAGLLDDPTTARRTLLGS